MQLRDWFQYKDRNQQPYNPSINTMITVDRSWKIEKNDFNDSDWRKEQWLIRSALIPVDQLDSAVIEISSPNCINFKVGWNFDNKFNFGNYSSYGDIQLYPLISSIMHPISKELAVELIRGFFIYHALDKKNLSQYYHPLDNILVAEINIETDDFYDPVPNAIIHRDYLRDFLASVSMGLLISVIADRFANALTKDALELEEVEDYQIDEFTWLSSNIHTPQFSGHGYFRGRSTLRRNFIIKPYDAPKFERSPWFYFGEKSVEDSVAPSFIVNDEGQKQVLPRNTHFGTYTQNGIGNYGYLYFRLEVLQKYLQVPNYSVFFHMRNWGVASLPGDRGTIDVGINSQGLVNAFAPDIAKLSVNEQSYWASFSSLPSGEVCKEMFETRIQCNPPNSLGVIELIRNARTKLNKVFIDKFSVDLFKDMEPSSQELSRLSVGSIFNQYTDVTELSKILYGWAIETMQVDSLRNALVLLGGTVDKNLRQIKLLEKILIAKGLDEPKARSITAPIVGLNNLRIGAAHIGSLELEPNFKLMGASSIPEPRAGWILCVDAIALCLENIAVNLKA